MQRLTEGGQSRSGDRRHIERRHRLIAAANPAVAATQAEELRAELEVALRPFPDHDTFQEDGNTED